MCGIFGYIGKKDTAAPIILEGLKLLEYRGYDSWGIAVVTNGHIEIQKQIGKIEGVQTSLPKSSIGIGHTRWATHGGITKINAHPHFDCTKQIALLHNGIIENFLDLKKELLKKGHVFLSETDTEVAVHLIEEYAKTTSLSNAVEKCFKRLKGLNALVVLSLLTNEIIAIKVGSPLIVGIGKEEYFISSDPIGIASHTKNVYFVQDNQLIQLGKTFEIRDCSSGLYITPTITVIDWDYKSSLKGKYKHFVLKEIYEQPVIITQIAKYGKEDVQKLTNEIERAYGTFIVGCGSASYAALYGTYLFSKVAKKHINFSIGSEFNYLEDYLTKKSLVIGISQSGETIDVVEPLSKALKKGSQIAVITNGLGSTMYRLADTKLFLNAGVEKAVMSTKALIAMLSVLLLCAYSFEKKQNEGSLLLEAAAKDVKRILSVTEVNKIKKLAKKLAPRQHIYLIGRGLSYAAVLEITLKLKEAAYIHAEGFAGGELKHGSLALIEKGSVCIVVAPNDETYASIISNAQEVKARGGYIIGFSPIDNQVFDYFLKTADLKEATIIPQVVIGQLLAYYLAIEKGVKDPDKPRNLAKSVTVK